MKVIWQVDDGYVGGQRPHITYIDDEDLAQCDNSAERQELIEEYIQEDFDQKVSWVIIREENEI